MSQSKKVRKRKRPPAVSRRQVPVDEPEENPDDAAAFMAEMLADLVRMARRHRLEMLTYLLSIAQLEAEEHVRLRSRGKLS